MVENYVKWFCQFINISYVANEILELWIIIRKQNKESKIENNISIDKSTKQLSLLDFDIAI
ncbi:TPA: hypothetical protein PI874_002483 [Staphylococcus aureus]|uniref:hypothetical protein n=1 Tax=Staphylococcus aureus TaxID=1280 RepID=UPI0013C5423A|nr:hypothetical protein [Staphylococcus aureus]QID98756.1 hypothetical protein GZ067_13745 [Staphylococcus aureus]HDH6518340.1 hypothetical protein [Staphylococcus aureus]HDH6520707.1 hypothetical protein [Staphylococcus aureus]HDH6523638.1 hypothetical protein [Staphylococcus aureus]HDH6525885.1 hypothetical protein [Staphylococcus aureus]